MIDLIRDSTVGQIINKLSSGRLLPYADQRLDYVVPSRYRLPETSTNTFYGDTIPINHERSRSSGDNASTRTLGQESGFVSTNGAEEERKRNLQAAMEGETKDLERGSAKLETTKDEGATVQVHPALDSQKDPYLVEWDGPNDPENPRYPLLSRTHFENFVIVIVRRNWSLFKRSFVAFSISLLTFSGQSFFFSVEYY